VNSAEAQKRWTNSDHSEIPRYRAHPGNAADIYGPGYSGTAMSISPHVNDSITGSQVRWFNFPNLGRSAGASVGTVGISCGREAASIPQHGPSGALIPNGSGLSHANPDEDELWIYYVGLI